MSVPVLGEWPDHNWQVWEYTVGHAQLHLRGIPTNDPGGECIDLLLKPVYRLAISTMSWSGLWVCLRRVTAEGAGVFFLVSTNASGPNQGHGVIRAGSLHWTTGGRTYSDPVLNTESTHWQTLWSSQS